MATTLTTAGLRTIVAVRATVETIKSNIVNACSSLMGESITFEQVTGVVQLVLGLAMLIGAGNFFVGLIGYIVLFRGALKLKD